MTPSNESQKSDTQIGLIRKYKIAIFDRGNHKPVVLRVICAAREGGGFWSHISNKKNHGNQRQELECETVPLSHSFRGALQFPLSPNAGAKEKK